VIEECENSREIVKRKGVDVYFGEIWWKDQLSLNLSCEGHPSYPVYAIGMAKDL
jgi:hypothetical protein